MRQQILVSMIMLLALFGTKYACAQAPFYTDDTGVTDAGTLHFEVSDEYDALQSMQYPDVRQNTANVKVNVGLPHGFEFDIDVPYLSIERTATVPGSHGVGDTNLGLKWRIRDVKPESHLPAFAVSFYTEYPTGNARQELGSGITDYWLNFIVQEPLSDASRFNVNLGILFAGNTSTGAVGIETKHSRVYTGGLSFLHDVDARLSVGAEVFGAVADSNLSDHTQLQTMVGAQYAISDSFSLYAGLIVGTYSASPRIGGQIGFAMDFPHVFDALNRVLFNSRTSGDSSL